MSDFKAFPEKHPTSILDYLFDWAPKRNNRGVSNWLREDETILVKTVTATNGITVVSSNIVDEESAVQVLLSGGTIDETYSISCRIETNQGRDDTRTATILIKNR